MDKWKDILERLETGDLRSATKVQNRWVPNVEAKKAILEAFRAGKNISQSLGGQSGFVDKETIPARSFLPEQGVRLVPGGSSVRTGAYLAPGTIVMPPSYINIGAYVDEGCLIDSHVLVGSCAQIGKHVHLSAGVQIGGVLEPIGPSPVVIEDHCFIGAGAILVEGIQVFSGAVIAPGTVLSRSVPVYDCIEKRVLDKEEGIPSHAVVVPGSRPLNARLDWGRKQGLSLSCALIVKYRDEKSDQSLELEDALRGQGLLK